MQTRKSGALSIASSGLKSSKDAAPVTPVSPYPASERAGGPMSSTEPPPRWQSIYRSASWIVGFREPYSLVLRSYHCMLLLAVGVNAFDVVIFFGGALVGFCLARSFMMNPVNVRERTVPGSEHCVIQFSMIPTPL
jgi:hypothetical protein